MRIEKMNPDADLYQGYCKDLERVVEAQKCADRPCTNCDAPCTAHKSPTCACACTPSCIQAPHKMSSDGEKFPIESGIAPLVLAFLQLREFTPCWSCGGHEAEAGRDARPPRMIFYARSTLYPALVATRSRRYCFKESWRVRGRSWSPRSAICWTQPTPCSRT